jgi:hypothetical protein
MGVQENALWTKNRTCHIPKNDDHGVEWSNQHKVFRFPGRYCNHCELLGRSRREIEGCIQETEEI